MSQSNEGNNDVSFVLSEVESELNISDLVIDHSIVLNRSSNSMQHGSKNLSFKSSEITARSTLYNTVGRQSIIAKDLSRLSIDDILSTSLAVEHARNLCKTLDDTGSETSFMNHSSVRQYNAAMSESLSCIDNASVTKSKHSFDDLCSEMSFGGNEYCDSGISKEDFMPGEHMQSKLLLDEISWAQKYAAVPTAVVSKEAKNKVQKLRKEPELYSSAVSNVTTNPKYSIGQFFNMRSDSLHNLVAMQSPLQDKQATVLQHQNATPVIDNLRYSKVPCNQQTVTLKKSRPEDNKDAGNSTISSGLLSTSAIDKALANFCINADASNAVVDQILKNTRKIQQSHDVDKVGSSVPKQLFGSALDNKENLDPKSSGVLAMSDTISFNESLLNTSDMRYLNRSSSSTNGSKSRSPISSIHLNAPILTITDTEIGNDADIDEWPSASMITADRRVRRKKSRSPHKSRSPEKQLNDSLGMANQISNDLTKTKTLCSTRVDSADLTNGNADIVASSSATKSSATMKVDCNTSPVNFDYSPTGSNTSSYSGNSPQLNASHSPNRNGIQCNGHSMAAAISKLAVSPANSDTGTIASVHSNCSCTTLRVGTARSISRCSNSSEFSHRDGKVLPLKVTSLELSWGSTKLRTDSHKSMQVKNISNKRLVLRLEVHGPGYQLVNAHSHLLTMQAQECRTIIVSFCPTVIGSAMGTLGFYAPTTKQTKSVQYLSIPLWGYGGNASITLQQVVKAPNGSPFITIGDCSQLHAPLETTFKIFNKGPLPGFALVSIASIGLIFPRLYDRFELYPSALLLPAGAMTMVRITFRPKREDIRKIIKTIDNVLTLAHLRIFCGDEANRQRMRSLVQRMNCEERKKIESSTLDKLWTKWPEEQQCSEFADFHETTTVIMDLLSNIRVHEVSLTLNNDNLDETRMSTVCFADADETVLFRTVCVSSPTPSNMLEPVEEELLERTVNANSMMNGVAQLEPCLSSEPTIADGMCWSVSPKSIEFDFKPERRAETVALLIRSEYRSRQNFEVTCSHKNLLRFVPCQGYVEASGGQVEVRVYAMCDILLPLKSIENVRIIVHLDNEHITVPVHIPADNFNCNSQHLQ